MNCSSTCRTKDHATFGECMRAKSLQVAGVDAHKYNQGVQSQIKDYVKAREAGLQPRSWFRKDVDFANRVTDKTGVPFRADK